MDDREVRKHGKQQGLPPCGGSGLKCKKRKPESVLEWRLPPCGGSGLKFKRVNGSDTYVGLPPCGGSGLKLRTYQVFLRLRRVSLHAEGVD